MLQEHEKSVRFSDDIVDPSPRQPRVRSAKAHSDKAFSQIDLLWYRAVKARLEQNLHKVFLKELPTSEVQRSKILTICDNAPFKWFASIGDVYNMRFLIENTPIRGKLILAISLNNYETVEKFISHCINLDLSSAATQRLLKNGWEIFTSLDEGLSVGKISQILSAHDSQCQTAVAAILAEFSKKHADEVGICAIAEQLEPHPDPAPVSINKKDESVHETDNLYDIAVRFAFDTANEIKDKLSVIAALIYQLLEAASPLDQTPENERQLDLQLNLMDDLNSLSGAMPAIHSPHVPDDKGGGDDIAADRNAGMLPVVPTGLSSNGTSEAFHTYGLLWNNANAATGQPVFRFFFDALIFKHGSVIKATWAKKDREAFFLLEKIFE